MGLRYLNGDGVIKDVTKSREYLTKAAAQGSQEANDELAKLDIQRPSSATNSVLANPATRSETSKQ
jgi:TPR repeat protein